MKDNIVLSPVHKRLEFERVESEQRWALTRLQDANEKYTEAMKELRPGEVSPGISEVMIRRGQRAKYRKMLILTPQLRPQSHSVIFTNNKNARIIGLIECKEEIDQPFLWITVEKT